MNLLLKNSAELSSNLNISAAENSLGVSVYIDQDIEAVPLNTC